VCILIPLVGVTCVSVGATCGGKHWSWQTCGLWLIIPFLVVGCLGGNDAFCRVLLVFGGGFRVVKSLFVGVSIFVWLFLGLWLGSCFPSLWFMCGQCSLSFFSVMCRLWDGESVFEFLRGFVCCNLLVSGKGFLVRKKMLICV
jgi:hypothetical protein